MDVVRLFLAWVGIGLCCLGVWPIGLILFIIAFAMYANGS